MVDVNLLREHLGGFPQDVRGPICHTFRLFWRWTPRGLVRSGVLPDEPEDRRTCLWVLDIVNFVCETGDDGDGGLCGASNCCSDELGLYEVFKDKDCITDYDVCVWSSMSEERMRGSYLP